MRWIVLKKTEGYFQQSNGQLTLFQPDFIRDADCTKETPVIYGKSDIPIYGMGKRICPRVSGRKDTEYMKKIYLEELLPLEMYDLVIVLISGGKDSIACYYKLLELGVRYVEDIDYQGCRIRVEPRVDNENKVRAKYEEDRWAKVSKDTFDILLFYYAKYRKLLRESEYLFITLSGEHAGQALTEDAVNTFYRSCRIITGYIKLETLQIPYICIPVDIFSL